MANFPYSYTVTLEKAHLEWGRHRYTNSRGIVYGEGYIAIPSPVARAQQLYNSNQTNGNVLGQNIFICDSSDGYLSNIELKAQGSHYAGDIYAKQFSAKGDLKVIGDWYNHMNCSVGDSVKVTWTSPTNIVITKI